MTLLDLGINVPIKHIQRRQQPANSEQSSDHKKLPDKLIINCLHCGKIFDFRGKSKDKVLDTCDFCYNAFGTTPSLLPPDIAALALKDRLVEYDKESAKRTTVYDDQSDYFEIDANAWLDDEEREALKIRAAVEAELKEERKRQIRVTFDLMGRTVIMDDNNGGGEEDDGGEDGGKNDDDDGGELLKRAGGEDGGKNDDDDGGELLKRAGGGNSLLNKEGNNRQPSSSDKMIRSTVLGSHDTKFTFTKKKKKKDAVVVVVVVEKKKKGAGGGKMMGKKEEVDGNNNNMKGLDVVSRVQYDQED